MNAVSSIGLDTRGISQSETPPALFENLRNAKPLHCDGLIFLSPYFSTSLLNSTVAIATVMRVSESNVT